jgi:hypothetical protein
VSEISVSHLICYIIFVRHNLYPCVYIRGKAVEKLPIYNKTEVVCTLKKKFVISLSLAGMSLTKLSLAGNNKIAAFPTRESLVSDIPVKL